VVYCREFLAPGAHNPVNVDGTITELVRNRMEVNPTRYVFDEAQVKCQKLIKKKKTLYH
jgi:hypothetical protein